MSRNTIFLVIALMLVTFSDSAWGKPTSVQILPPAPVTTDTIAFKTTLDWFTGGYDVIGSSVTFISDFNPQIDITVSSPAPGEIVPQVLTSDVHSTTLGQLPAGTYSYTINEIQHQRVTDIAFHRGSLMGSFTVATQGDFSGDDIVEANDLALLLDNWGQTNRPEDWTSSWDGFVDANELAALLDNWGAGVGDATEPLDIAAIKAVVPEPAAFSLLILGGLAALGGPHRFGINCRS